MTTRKLIPLGVVTAVLWVVPSIGTQGMGTIDAHVVHADATLFDAVPTHRIAARELLLRADAEVEAAGGM